MIEAIHHPDEIQIIPVAAIRLGRCGHCPQVHAIMIEIGWLTLSIEIASLIGNFMDDPKRKQVFQIWTFTK